MSIAADSADVRLTDAQRAELQKRIEEDDANPDDVTPWEKSKLQTLARRVDSQWHQEPSLKGTSVFKKPRKA
jgi:putative addiction module component (TIGR02574 family)